MKKVKNYLILKETTKEIMEKSFKFENFIYFLIYKINNYYSIRIIINGIKINLNYFIKFILLGEKMYNAPI